MHEENKLIVKAVRWALITAEEIDKAGGSPRPVILGLTDEQIVTLVRNDLFIRFEKRED